MTPILIVWMLTKRRVATGFVLMLTALPLALHALQESRVSGVVTDVEGNPLEGASVSIVEPAGVPPVRSDASGRFELRDLLAGRITIRVTLPGFRPETRGVVVLDGATERLTVVLRIGVLIEGMVVMRDPRDSLRQSKAVAHIRLDALDEPGPCGDATAVAAVHNATVLELWRGAVPKKIKVLQGFAGTCYDSDGKTVQGINTVRAIGSEYVVFLDAVGTRFNGVGSDSYAFPVTGGLVTTNGVFGLADTVTLREFRRTLERQRR